MVWTANTELSDPKRDKLGRIWSQIGDCEMAAVFKSKRACIMAFKILVVIIVFNV